MSKYMFTEGEIIPSDIMSQGGLRITPLPTEPGEPQRYLAERISLPEPSIYLHNNIPAPTCEGWWWAWNKGEALPIRVANGRPGEGLVVKFNFWSPNTEWELLDDYVFEGFTGPIPEPAKPEEGV